MWFNTRIVDLAASYTYADSIHDLSLLEAVGHPVAVSPEERLASIARQRGWPIPDQVREKPWGARSGAQEHNESRQHTIQQVPRHHLHRRRV